MQELDFETITFSKKDLNSEKFVNENPESNLAINVFGKDKNVGRARISINTVNTKEWEQKRDKKIKECKKQISKSEVEI